MTKVNRNNENETEADKIKSGIIFQNTKIS